MSELPSYSHSAIDAEGKQESSLSTRVLQNFISETIDKDVSHGSASDVESGNAPTPPENVSLIIYNVQPLNPFPTLTGYACHLVTKY